MGIKFKIPSDWERRRELLNILVTTFNLDWHLKHLCCRVVFVWQQFIIVFGYGNIGYLQWTLKNYMDMYIYSLVIMFKYGWVPADKDSYRFMSRVKPFLFQSSWYQTLFQNSDIIPELRYCSRFVDARHWAKMLGLLLLLLLLLQRSLPQSVARDSILHSQ